jgi:predicted  nucleic acid-binding Zn-ribbon protein
MVPALLHLIDIQRIDVKIDALDKQRAQVSEKLNQLKKKLDETKLALGQVEFQATEKDRERRAIDGNLGLDGGKLKKWEARLNEIRNQREYLALSREIETQKKQNLEQQEKMNTLGNEIRDLNVKLESLRDDLAEGEVDVDTEQQAVDGKMKELDVQLAEHKKERSEFLTQVPAQLLKRYDMIRAKRGAALAPCFSGRCSACNMSLAPQLYNTVIRGDTIEACPSCMRIIYYREPEKSAEVQA